MPPGTVQIGGPIEWFSIAIGVKGEFLVPEEITALLRREPDRAWQKDKPLYREDGSIKRTPKFGAWWADLKREDTDEWDCGEAIAELLATLPSEPAIWRGLAERFSVALSVGLSLESSGCGFELSPEVLSYLGERRITAGFEVYIDDANKG